MSLRYGPNEHERHAAAHKAGVAFAEEAKRRLEFAKCGCADCSALDADLDSAIALLDGAWRANLGANFIAAGLAAEIARLNGASMDGSSCTIDKRVRGYLCDRFIPKAGAP